MEHPANIFDCGARFNGREDAGHDYFPDIAAWLHGRGGQFLRLRAAPQ
jgi:hypothetical protein